MRDSPQELPSIIAAEKWLESSPEWDTEADPYRFTFTAPLRVSIAAGTQVPDLRLRAAAPKTRPGGGVVFQLEWRLHAEAGWQPLWRCEWRPPSPHTNPNLGPAQLRLLRIDGTHEHPFDLNWIEGEGRMRSGNLRVARRLEPEPEAFADFLALCADRFRIANMHVIAAPPWPADRL